MSNVLIGIIGVILFIGLALAGALFLGPRFQESANNSKAAAAVQIVSQMASAARLYEVQEGRKVTPNESGTTLETTTSTPYQQIVGGGYVKSVPSNPTETGGVYYSEASGFPLTQMGVGLTPAVCRAVNRNLGNGDVDDVAIATVGKNSGCAKRPYGAGFIYLLWERI
jgi:hypothetical protein